MWDGLKGYITNSKMTSEEIQSNYSHLWQSEKAFRISKTDLRIRPIYHRKKNIIEAHICIVFATYAVFKELEIKLKNSKLNISVNDAVEYLKNMYQVSFYIPEIARKVATWNSLTPEQNN